GFAAVVGWTPTRQHIESRVRTSSGRCRMNAPGLTRRSPAPANFRLVGRKKVWCRIYEYLHARPPYRWEDKRNGTVQPVAWRPEQRDFLVRADCGGRCVLVEQFYPGWIATGAAISLFAGVGLLLLVVA